jgi:hypothetical protein
MNRITVWGRRGCLRCTSRRLHLEALEDRTVPSVDPVIAINGLGANGFVPPDTDAAAGPDYVIETINLQIAYNRKSDGVRTFQQSLASFFSPLGGVLQMSDPVITFDEYTNQFVVGVLDYNSPPPSTLNRFDLAISNDADPNDGWTFSRYDMQDTPRTLADYPKLGYNADAYVVSFNMLPGTGNHVDTLSIDKSDLTGHRVVWDTSVVGFPGMAPAAMHGANPGDPMWFVSGDPSARNIRVFRMDDVLSDSPTMTRTLVPVPAYTIMPRPTQPGSPSSMNWTFDTRMMNAAMSNGQLVATHTVGSGGVAHARWYEVDTTGDTPVLAQEGQIDQGTGVHTYFPTIEINQEGDLGMTFIESSPDEYMSMYVTGQNFTDAPGTMQTPVQTHAGNSPYTQNRAGDYSGITVDPIDGYTFWAANEYKGTVLGIFSTGIAAFGVSPSGAAPSARLPRAVAFLNRANPSPAAGADTSAPSTVAALSSLQQRLALLDWLFLSTRRKDLDGLFSGSGESTMTESVLSRGLTPFTPLWGETLAP